MPNVPEDPPPARTTRDLLIDGSRANAVHLHQRILHSVQAISLVAWVPTPVPPLQALLIVWLRALVGRDYNDEPDPNLAIALRQEYTQRLLAYGAAAVAPLLDLCQHADWAVRDYSAMLLGQLGDSTVIPTLLHLMYEDESRSVQLSAATALDTLGPAAVRDLVDRWYQQTGIPRPLDPRMVAKRRGL